MYCGLWPPGNASCLFVTATTIFATLESAIGFDLAYDAPLGTPLFDVVVDLKSAHMYASECKNIVNYLLHLTAAAVDEFNQAFQHKL
jgi:hypothetical protein